MGELGFAQSGIGFPDAEQGGTEGTPFFKVSDMNTPGNEYELVASNNYVTAEQIARMGWRPINQVPAIFFAKVGAAVMLNRKRLINEPFLLDNNTMAFSMDSSLLDTQFGQSLFERLDLTSLIQVGALPSFNSSDVESIFVSLPSTMNEQRQIGQYLCDLNTLITLHQRKCQYRSLYGYLSWEQRKLNEYLETSREKNESCHFGKDDVLSVSGDYGIVNQIEFQGRSYAGTSVANYGVVHKGDVVYTKSPLRINPYGIIKTNRGNDGIVSTLYAVYHPTEKTHPDFVQVYFEQNARMNNYMAPLVSKGAKNDMKVSAENALKGAVTFPGIKEQEVIASYFSQLDDLITLHQ